MANWQSSPLHQERRADAVSVAEPYHIARQAFVSLDTAPHHQSRRHYFTNWLITTWLSRFFDKAPFPADFLERDFAIRT